jgi:DnaK suppressor protein
MCENGLALVFCGSPLKTPGLMKLNVRYLFLRASSFFVLSAISANLWLIVRIGSKRGGQKGLCRRPPLAPEMSFSAIGRAVSFSPEFQPQGTGHSYCVCTGFSSPGLTVRQLIHTGVAGFHQKIARRLQGIGAVVISARKSGSSFRMSATDLIDEKYRPTDDEEFMNERQREYFRRKLLSWKDDILTESKQTLAALQAENENHSDIADRASSETDRAIELRARDRQRKLIAKIDAALERLAEGTYGYCEETGEPISLKRLDARPIATLSLEAQERHEKRERVYRDE